MAYIALRPCSFAGEKFYVGDVVPNALIRPEMVRRLIAAGVVTEVREPPEPAESKLEVKPESTESKPEAKSEANPPKSVKKSAAKEKEAGDV